MLLLVTSSACWKASRPETLVDRRSAMPFAPLERGGTVGYRPRVGELDLRLTGAAAGHQRRHLLGDAGDLGRVVRIGGIPTFLQGTGKGAHVTPRAECGAVARVAAQRRDIILQRRLRVGVGAEGAARTHEGARLKLLSRRRHRVAAPAAGGLHPEEVVAARPGGALGRAATPVALERSLRDHAQGLHTQLPRGSFSLRPQRAHELCALGGRRGRGGRSSRRARCSRGRAGGLGRRGGCRRGAGSAPQLLHQHVGESQAMAPGELERQLVIEHALVHLGLVAAEDRILADGLAHALEHHLGEQALELLRHLAQRARVLLAYCALELLEPREVTIDTGAVGAVGYVGSHGGRCNGLQMTMSSARSAPASRSASRIATRSPGAAPTWFTARTISSRLTPAWNTNMRASACWTSIVLRGVTTV